MGLFDDFFKNPLSIFNPTQGILDTASSGAHSGITAGIAGAVLPGVADIYNVHSQAETNKRMMDQSERHYQTSREDQNTAVQRRAADMIKAGINPLLAAGDAAGVSQGSTPSLTAPQMRGPSITEAISLQEMLKNNAADRRLKSAQARSTEQNVNLLTPAEQTAKDGNTLLQQGKKFIKDWWKSGTIEEQNKLKRKNPSQFMPINKGPISKPAPRGPNDPWTKKQPTLYRQPDGTYQPFKPGTKNKG